MINTNCFLIKVLFFVVCTPVSGSSSFLFLEHPLGENGQSETWWDRIPPTKQVKSLSPQIVPPSVYFLPLSRLKPFSPFRRSVGMDNRLRLQSSVEKLQTGMCTRATAANHIFVLVCDNKSMHQLELTPTNVPPLCPSLKPFVSTLILPSLHPSNPSHAVYSQGLEGGEPEWLRQPLIFILLAYQ